MRVILVAVCLVALVAAVSAQQSCDPVNGNPSDGTYCAGNTITTCPEGYYCAKGARQTTTRNAVLPCYRGGYYCPAGSSSLFQQNCQPGTYCPTRPTCTTGNCDPGNISPTTCPAGYYCNSGSDTTCTPSFCLAGAITPTSCDAGNYCPSGSASQTVCPAGSFCTTQAPSPTDCPARYFCPQGSSTGTVNQCPAGYFCPVRTASNTSNVCTSGYFCPAGTASGTENACGVGYSCPAGSSTGTSPCPAGYYCTGGPGGGQCPAGYFCPVGTGSSTANSCPAGYFCPVQSSNGTANLCLAGSYCPAGSSTPSQCLPGTFCPAGSPSPRPCPPGSYCPAANSASASLCFYNTYCPAGSTSYLTCPPAMLCKAGSGAPVTPSFTWSFDFGTVISVSYTTPYGVKGGAVTVGDIIQVTVALTTSVTAATSWNVVSSLGTSNPAAVQGSTPISYTVPWVVTLANTGSSLVSNIDFSTTVNIARSGNSPIVASVTLSMDIVVLLPPGPALAATLAMTSTSASSVFCYQRSTGIYNPVQLAGNLTDVHFILNYTNTGDTLAINSIASQGTAGACSPVRMDGGSAALIYCTIPNYPLANIDELFSSVTVAVSATSLNNGALTGKLVIPFSRGDRGFTDGARVIPAAGAASIGFYPNQIALAFDYYNPRDGLTNGPVSLTDVVKLRVVFGFIPGSAYQPIPPYLTSVSRNIITANGVQCNASSFAASSNAIACELDYAIYGPTISTYHVAASTRYRLSRQVTLFNPDVVATPSPFSSVAASYTVARDGSSNGVVNIGDSTLLSVTFFYDGSNDTTVSAVMPGWSWSLGNSVSRATSSITASRVRVVTSSEIDTGYVRSMFRWSTPSATGNVTVSRRFIRSPFYPAPFGIPQPLYPLPPPLYFTASQLPNYALTVQGVYYLDAQNRTNAPASPGDILRFVAIVSVGPYQMEENFVQILNIGGIPSNDPSGVPVGSSLGSSVCSAPGRSDGPGLYVTCVGSFVLSNQSFSTAVSAIPVYTFWYSGGETYRTTVIGMPINNGTSMPNKTYTGAAAVSSSSTGVSSSSSSSGSANGRSSSSASSSTSTLSASSRVASSTAASSSSGTNLKGSSSTGSSGTASLSSSTGASSTALRSSSTGTSVHSSSSSSTGVHSLPINNTNTVVPTTAVVVVFRFNIPASAITIDWLRQLGEDLARALNISSTRVVFGVFVSAATTQRRLLADATDVPVVVLPAEQNGPADASSKDRLLAAYTDPSSAVYSALVSRSADPSTAPVLTQSGEPTAVDDERSSEQGASMSRNTSILIGVLVGLGGVALIGVFVFWYRKKLYEKRVASSLKEDLKHTETRTAGKVVAAAHGRGRSRSKSQTRDFVAVEVAGARTKRTSSHSRSREGHTRSSK